MKLLEDILKEIKPSPEEEKNLMKIVKKMENGINNNLPPDATCMLVGSVAKGTYLKNNLDIDFFVLFPFRYSKREMEEIVINVGKKLLKSYRIQYAEHPYIRGVYEGYQIDIVPCYKIERIEDMKSSVDRTPFHTEFVIRHMDEKMKDETRLLKQFLKGIGCYGAEAKIEGFSGYLAELLIIKYGDFLNVVRNASKWRGKVFLSVGVEAAADFPEKFVFVDPVDPKRNVAAAVAPEKFDLFIRACRDFERMPTRKFFFPNPPPLLPREEIEKKLKNFIGICFEKPPLVDDIIYPQLKKAAKSMEKLFIQYDFKPIRKAWFANEEAFVLLELERKEIGEYKIHMGPPIWQKEHVERFRRKWGNKTFQKEGRIWVKMRRRYTNAENLLRDKLNELSLGKNIDEIKDEIRICGKETARFAEFWSEFFCHLPPWKR